jgi:hypothetical protein
MVQWFVKIAASVEELTVMLPFYSPGLDLDLLPAMLAIAGTVAPNLRCLNIGGEWRDIPLMHLLVLLSQIKELTLQDWAFSAVMTIPEILRLSGLQSLEVRVPLLPTSVGLLPVFCRSQLRFAQPRPRVGPTCKAWMLADVDTSSSPESPRPIPSPLPHPINTHSQSNK